MKNISPNKMRTVLLASLLVMLSMAKVYAYDFSSVCSTGQTLFYNVTDSVNHYVEVTFQGTTSQPWFGPAPTGQMIIPESVEFEDVDYMVTSIGYMAFYGCQELYEITIPETVTRVHTTSFMFTGWYNQQGDDDILYLSNCCLGSKSGYPVGHLNLNDSTRIIADWAFADCYLLTGSLTIPNAVTHIGEYAFAEGFSGGSCAPNFTSVILGNSVTTIGQCAFWRCSSLTGSLVIPNSVTTIGPSAFSGCTGITGSLVIPNSVTTISQGAFRGCTGITGSLILPNSVNSIQDMAFSECENLTSINLPESLAYLGNNAFSNCARLTNVYYQVQNKLEAGDAPFSNCTHLTTIYIDSDVMEIGADVFKGCLTVHFIVAFGETPAFLETGTFEDIRAIVMVPCGNTINYYSHWNSFSLSSFIEDCTPYLISIVVDGDGGAVVASSDQVQMGQTVTLTITPDAGMMLSSINVANVNDPQQVIPVYPVSEKPSSAYCFTMPPFEVVVNATFSPNTSVDESVVTPVLASVYPNPTTGNVKIEAEGLQFISIFNTLGQLVYDNSVKGDVFECDLGCYETGIYFICVETTIGITTKKILLRR